MIEIHHEQGMFKLNKHEIILELSVSELKQR